MVNTFKPFIDSSDKKVTTVYYFGNSYTDTINDIEYDITFNTTFTQDDDLDTPYDIYADTGIDDINFNIIYSPTLFSPSQYIKLVPEIKETIRHELEHVMQAVNPNKNISRIEMKYKDYISPDEIDAYLRGFHVNAKSSKLPILVVIDDWFNEHIRQFDSPSDINIIKYKWLRRGNEILPLLSWE